MIRPIVVLCALLIVGVACGGSSETGVTPGTAQTAGETDFDYASLEGCTLLTRDEVAAAVGGPVGEGEPRGLVGCGWRAESGIEVVLQVFPGGEGPCEGQRFLVSGQEQELDGLGDSALWGSSGDLVVCTEKVVLKIDVDNTPNSPDEDRDVAVSLAKTVLGRI